MMMTVEGRKDQKYTHSVYFPCLHPWVYIGTNNLLRLLTKCWVYLQWTGKLVNSNYFFSLFSTCCGNWRYKNDTNNLASKPAYTWKQTYDQYDVSNVLFHKDTGYLSFCFLHQWMSIWCKLCQPELCAIPWLPKKQTSTITGG